MANSSSLPLPPVTSPSPSSLSSPSSSLHPEGDDFGILVAMAMEDQHEVFCLGAILSQFSILTLASCFDDKQVLVHMGDEHHQDGVAAVKERRKRRSPPKVLRLRNQPVDYDRDSVDYESYYHDKSIDLNKTVYDDEDRSRRKHGTAVNCSDTNEDDYYYDYDDDLAIAREPFRLYWIPHIELKRFVKLEAKGESVVIHPEYTKLYKENLEPLHLWKYDVACVSTDMAADFSRNPGIHSIPLLVDDPKNQFKTNVTNTTNCQVMGIVKSADRTTRVECKEVKSVTIHVEVNDEDCLNGFCSAIESFHFDNCLETGHHIIRDPVNPFPDVIEGSALVCNGKLLSVANANSQCNTTRFSAEFPSPQTIDQLLHPEFTDEMNNEGTDLAEIMPKRGNPPNGGHHDAMVPCTMAFAVFMLGYKSLDMMDYRLLRLKEYLQ